MAEGFTADQAKVDDLPRALEWLTFNDVRPAAAVAGGEVLGEARFTTFDGTAITLRLVSAEEKRWALISTSWSDPGALPETAQAELKPAAEARAEAEALATRHASWAYQLVDWKTDILLYRPEDVAAPAPRDPS
jgi:hypothetical protein